MHMLRTRAVRAHTVYTVCRANLQARLDRLLAEPESGMDDIPWKMILMIGGGVIAVAIVTAIFAFVKAQLAQLPSTPNY